jgi:threonylcarbamoyladenosine tRNA methylthiotransferase MtaB
MSKIALETLGCKLNQAEVETLAHQLVAKGYELTESIEEADIYMLNTCTVTHVADRKSRQLLKAARRQNPRATILAAGCYAQRAPEELGRLGVANLILGNKEKDRLLEVVGSIGEPRNGTSTGCRSGWQSRTRALVKIQEGCSTFCSFCVVPYVRGREHSLPLDEVLHEVRARLAAGHKEIVLTGTNIGRYSWNGHGSRGLPALVRQILNEPGVVRLRLSSLQPKDVSPELVRLWSDERLCPHLHISLQSGSEAILQRMNRKYTASEYERAIYSINEAIPDLAITTDIMVGFAGEGQREFEESYKFCERMNFANMHVFPYSARHGTSASKMPDQVEEKVKKERSRIMLTLARESSQRFRGRFLSRAMKVLWESRVDNTTWKGLTANYLRVFTQSSDDLSNQLLDVKLLADNGHALVGETVEGGYITNG